MNIEKLVAIRIHLDIDTGMQCSGSVIFIQYPGFTPHPGSATLPVCVVYIMILKILKGKSL
jgi:hypothetical protein